MNGFFAYDLIKEFVVYSAFGWFVGLYILGFSYWIVTGCRWIISGMKWAAKVLRERFGKKNIIKEEHNNE